MTAAVELLKALAAPVRLAVVAELASGPRCVHGLVEVLGVSQPHEPAALEMESS